MKLYKIKFKVWDMFFTNLICEEMLSVGNTEQEAINKVKNVIREDARDFVAEEINEVFGYTVTINEKKE